MRDTSVAPNTAIVRALAGDGDGDEDARALVASGPGIPIDDGLNRLIDKARNSVLMCCGCESARQEEHSRVKVEPKTYFVNERTFLQWFNASVLVGTLGIALVGLDSSLGLISLMFVVIGILLMCYALYTYHVRLRNIAQRRTTGYHDSVGPSVLTVLLMLALIIFSFGQIFRHPSKSAPA